jgi:polar amino acid transport system substrate-binding protein
MTNSTALADLAPRGVLRAAINLSNPLLVTGKGPQGEPQGVSPDMAKAIADRLGVKFEYVTYPNPGLLADGMAKGEWDIGLIAIEPARAETICFSPSYVEIEVTYLVPAGSKFQRIEDVDSKGTRIAISARSAYDLYLTRTLQHAELVRAGGLGAAVQLFGDEKLDALAGLRPALLEDVAKFPGARILPGQFTAVQQAIGCNPNSKAGAEFIRAFVEEAKKTGFVASLIDKHGVQGRLAVSRPA